MNISNYLKLKRNALKPIFAVDPCKRLNVKDIFVVKAEYISSNDDGKGFGPKYTCWYYLASVVNDKYYNIFSGQEIEKKENHETDICLSCNFDTPYIVAIEPLSEYMNSTVKDVSVKDLSWFINNTNILYHLGAFENSDDDSDIDS